MPKRVEEIAGISEHLLLRMLQGQPHNRASI